MNGSVLSLSNVVSGYGASEVLQGVTIEVRPGETVCLLGSNAAGKTTTLRTILGLVRVRSGEVVFNGERIDGLKTPAIVAKGITMVPENRRLFAKMSVRENLEIGANLRTDKAAILKDIEGVFEMFPRLSERAKQRAGTLSGGEQQMLAIGRALMADPAVLLMDEPSMGLAPILVEQVFEKIQEISGRGVTIFLVEQNANLALSIADRAYVIQTGRIVLQDTAEALLANPDLSKAYLGELDSVGE
ncbi:MAG: ABC transporter ATP-binding protein [Actinobacteria bacterium]|nr:ABC transporter ATP-binding protein [Actinomycetota bacterium]MCI0544558.1 ABC transporter ATP-binding protein [Actinomycetota bacterium]MCI0679372.1 ABC transporter ATP-binding protein [Actinomycetota bacterium]